LGRANFPVSKLLLSLLMAGSISSAFADSVLPSCATATLSSYIANTVFPGGGCAIGDLDYYQFSYHAVSNAPSDTAILVSQSALGTGFNFSLVNGLPFTAAAGEIVEFEIDYNILIDPAPVIPQGKLSVDPPSGDVTITQYYCNDKPYEGSGYCLGGLAPILQVGTPETGLPYSATITFSKPVTTSQGTGILFTLEGLNGKPSTFDGVDSTSTLVYLDTPEPAPWACLILGLSFLGAGYKPRKQRNPAK
jgi:hypothetical protein